MQNQSNFSDFSSLQEVINFFDNPDKCKAYLEVMRWGGHITCPHCSHDKVYTFKKTFNYKCAKCRKPFSVTKGTIFENSAIPLKKWYGAIYQLTTEERVTSIQLSKDLKITQKSAWFLLQRLRGAMWSSQFNRPLPVANELAINNEWSENTTGKSHQAYA